MNKSIGGNRLKFLIPSLLSAGVSVLVGAVLLGIEASMISNGSIKMEQSVIINVPVQFLALFLGCTSAGLMAKDGHMLSCVATVLITYFILLCITILFFDGVFGNVLLEGGAGLVGSAVAIWLQFKKKSRSKFKVKKIKHR